MDINIYGFYEKNVFLWRRRNQPMERKMNGYNNGNRAAVKLGAMIFAEVECVYRTSSERYKSTTTKKLVKRNRPRAKIVWKTNARRTNTYTVRIRRTKSKRPAFLFIYFYFIFHLYREKRNTEHCSHNGTYINRHWKKIQIVCMCVMIYTGPLSGRRSRAGERAESRGGIDVVTSATLDESVQ